MEVTLADPRGFCSGVNRAINILEELVQNVDPPVYAYHEIVHNAWVVGRFRRQGVVFVDSLDEVPDGATLLFSAHGVSPQIREEAASRGIKTIDATCPLVHIVHSQARDFAAEGYKIVLIGKRDHDETIGALGEAPDDMVLVSSLEEIDALDFSADQKLTYLTQTTLSATEAAEIIGALRKKFPQLKSPKREGLCDATKRRQEAVRNQAPGRDVVLVVGSENSSNSKRLAEVAESVGVPAYLVNGVEDIPWSKLTPDSKVLLTAGASAPESVVQACAQFLRDI
ncbi:MAG: 4-hydroxy-3-methylbut-2-enyl diphosphate reductase [Thermoguttaceae bacterium]|nr:4-hydroxy-3-methylbut-2-enyl diphosphate reductase [Thermoguttaceae bacterium]